MRNGALTVLLAASALSFSPAAARAAQMIYSSVWTSSDSLNHLLSIDVGSGAVTDIGVITVAGQPGHVPGVSGLSRHVDGQLYAFDTYGNQIITIDTTTALGTSVTPIGDDLGGWMWGLAIEPSGVYYVSNQQLRTVRSLARASPSGR